MKKDREDKEKNTSNALFFAVLMYISLTFFSGFFFFLQTFLSIQPTSKMLWNLPCNPLFGPPIV